MSKNWKQHQAAVARAFRMVTTGVRVAPPDCPDAVDFATVSKRLELDRFAAGVTSSRFLPEAKSGYKPAKHWCQLRTALKAASKKRTASIAAAKTEDNYWVVRLADMADLLQAIEIRKELQTLMICIETAAIPENPVRHGFEQLARYRQKPQYCSHFPAVVWHHDHQPFDNDLVFFRPEDMRTLGGHLLKILDFTC